MHEVIEQPSVEPGPATLAAPPPSDAVKDEVKLPPIWRNREYMLLWSGQIVSTLGSGMSGFVLPLLILAITNSPQAAGIAAALFGLPYPLFSLPAGALMDRWNRKRVMITCDIIRAANAASIVTALALGILTVGQIYVNAFIEGSCFVFFNIAEVAALPRVVDKLQLPQAAGQNEVAASVVGLVSPPLGGFLFKSVGQAFPFLFDAISYVVSIVSLGLMRTRFQTERTKRDTRLVAEIKEGLSWMWQHRLIRYLALLVSGYNFVIAPLYLILIVLARSGGADAATIGLMFSVASVGALLGALISGAVHRRLSFRQIVVGAMWINAIGFPLLLLSNNIFVLGAINGLIFFTIPIFNVAVLSYRLSLIPDQLQGRVNSAVRLIAWGSGPIGTFLGGVLLEQAGNVITIIFFASVLLLIALATALNPEIRAARSVAGASPATH